MVLNDALAEHPKLLRAAEKVGLAEALALYVASIGYARRNLTDGFVPYGFVQNSSIGSDPQVVARALCGRTVRLFHRAPGGYVIHDYLEHNENAKEVKEIRAKNRARMAAWRKGKNGS